MAPDPTPSQPHSHERRPHAFIGRFSDAKCKICHLERYNTDEIHSAEAIHTELQRLWNLEDEFLQIADEPFHRLTITPTQWFITHPLACRARGLHLCHHARELLLYTEDDEPFPDPGDYRFELSGSGSDFQLDFHPIPVRASCT